MKIASLSFMDFETGSGRYALGLANSLSNFAEVSLFTSQNNKIYLEEYNNNLNVEYIKLFRPYGSLGKKWFGFRNPINALSVALLVHRIQKLNPDIIHIQNGFEWLFLGLPIIKKYPIITTLHDPIPHTGENTWLQRFVVNNSINNSDGIIIHGQKLKESFHKKFKFAKDKIFVARLVYDLSIENTSSSDNLRNTILFQGRIVSYKGLENLIAAEPLVSKVIPDLKIIIAGNGNIEPYLNKVKNLKRYEIINRWVSKQELYSIFKKSNLVVLPYNDATQSAIIPLAYAFGKPVVTTDVGALSEVVEHGKTGLLVPRKNIIMLAAAIIKILKDDSLRKKMGNNGSNFLKEKLSWKSGFNAKAMISIYGKVIKNKKMEIR